MQMFVCICLAVSCRGCRTSDPAETRLKPEANSPLSRCPLTYAMLFFALSRSRQSSATGYYRRGGANGVGSAIGPGGMSLSQRSHSAAPSDNYHAHQGHPGSGYGYRSSSPRRGSLSPPDDRYIDYPVLPIHGSPNATAYGGGSGASAAAQTSQQQRFQSRSATATPTGSPKKRQLPQVSRKLPILKLLVIF